VNREAKMASRPDKHGRRWFVANVDEMFHGTYRLKAKDEKDAKRIVEEEMTRYDNYRPSNDGTGYRRAILVDPD
jgi:hypothetical protein